MRILAIRSVTAIASIWPVVHIAASVHLHINPWLFGGWGMYAVPPPKVTAASVYSAPAGLPPVPPPAEDLVAAGEILAARIRDFGQLAVIPRSRYVRALAKFAPGVMALTYVSRQVFDPFAARYVAENYTAQCRMTAEGNIVCALTLERRGPLRWEK